MVPTLTIETKEEFEKLEEKIAEFVAKHRKKWPFFKVRIFGLALWFGLSFELCCCCNCL
jgi:hypothetical protein